MRRSRSPLMTALLVAAATGPAQAMLTVGPDIIAAPPSAVDDFPGAENSHQQAFNERQGVLLLSDLVVDGGLIPSGTVVNSHLIFLNTRGDTSASDTQTWAFGGLILGVMSDVNGNREAQSSSFLGAPVTVHPPAFTHRGLETNDLYRVAGDATAVTMHVTEPGDWIRVVTAPSKVPEPGAVLLAGLGTLVVGWLRARRLV